MQKIIYFVLFIYISYTYCKSFSGIPKYELPLYDVDTFICKESGEIISGSKVNDDYCDCIDGSDEPGTSACSHLIILNSYENPRDKGFYCTNKGHKSKYIPTSFVNDGICDCCDGSDEYNDDNTCSNTCKELGKYEHIRVLKEIELHEAGAKEKQKMIEEAKTIKPSLQQNYDDSKKLVDELEIKLKLLEEDEERAKEIKEIADTINDDDSEDWIREDEEVDDEEKFTRREDPERNNKKEEFIEKYKMTPKEVIENYKEKKTLAKDCRRELNDEKTRMEQYKVLIETDFGVDDEFLALRGKALSTQAGGYQYEVKLFETAKQGGTLLGNWEGWKKKYTQMSYTGGKRCWGAGDREALIYVDCGLENTIDTVDEPSICFYTIKLHTPAACSLEHAQALRLNLETNFHDEEEKEEKKKSSWF